MRHLLVFLLLLPFALASLAMAQQNQPPIYGGPKIRLSVCAPPLVQTLDADGLLTVHEDGLISLVSTDDLEELSASFYTSGHSKAEIPQGPLGQEPVPLLSSTWCDDKGITHEVVTPIVSTTPAGMQKAVELHTALVAKMQALHPPKPCPPPPPPPPPPGG